MNVVGPQCGIYCVHSIYILDTEQNCCYEPRFHIIIVFHVPGETTLAASSSSALSVLHIPQGLTVKGHKGIMSEINIINHY